MARRSIRVLIKALITSSKVNLILFTLTVVVTSTYVISVFLQNNGTFTIMTPRQDEIQYGLILSDTPGFERPRSELRARALDNMWNITEEDLPANIDQVNGDHNGENYLAFTFYVKNDGDDDFQYESAIDITEMHLAVDNALRVKIYRNGKPSIYAKMGKNGTPEPETSPFTGKTRIIKLPKSLLKIGQVEKYTVVAWLEGNDPECLNDILGGSVKMTMRFSAYMPSKKVVSSSASLASSRT